MTTAGEVSRGGCGSGEDEMEMMSKTCSSESGACGAGARRRLGGMLDRVCVVGSGLGDASDDVAALQ